MYAIEAMKLLWDNLYKSVINNDSKSNEKVAKASNLAGRVINIAKTTAPHALSYYLTSRYKIPHGHAVNFFLPFFIIYNFNLNDTDCNDSRGIHYIKNKIQHILEIISCTINDIPQRMFKFYNDLGINIKLSSFGVNLKNYYQIFDNINLERLNNNPRKINIEELKKYTLTYLI